MLQQSQQHVRNEEDDDDNYRIVNPVSDENSIVFCYSGETT